MYVCLNVCVMARVLKCIMAGNGVTGNIPNLGGISFKKVCSKPGNKIKNNIFKVYKIKCFGLKGVTALCSQI